MEDMDSEDALALKVLSKIVDGHPSYLIRTYEAHRVSKDGTDHMITVKVTDRGPEEEYDRYDCEAFSDNGKSASGNSARTIDEALAVVHWYELD
jgi:hypothetical protein